MIAIVDLRRERLPLPRGFCHRPYVGFNFIDATEYRLAFGVLLMYCLFFETSP